MKATLLNHKYTFAMTVMILFLSLMVILKYPRNIAGVYRYCESGAAPLRSNVIIIDLNQKKVINADVAGDIKVVNGRMHRAVISPFLLSYPKNSIKNFEESWKIDGAIFKIERIKGSENKMRFIGIKEENGIIHKTVSIVSYAGEVDSILDSYDNKSQLIINACHSRGFNINEI